MEGCTPTCSFYRKCKFISLIYTFKMLYSPSSLSKTNTFQGILITNKQQSYAVFTYKCGLIRWSGDASIGFNTDGQFYHSHYLSLTSNASMVSCINSYSAWTNIVYQLCKWNEYFGGHLATESSLEKELEFSFVCSGCK